MGQPETRLVQKIRKAIIDQHPEAFIVKLAGGPYQTPGLPDLLVCLGGRFIGLEVKARRAGESEDHARARATGIQEATLAAIREAGGVAEVVLSVDEALSVLSKK